MGQRFKLTIPVIVVSLISLLSSKAFAAFSFENKNIEDTCSFSPTACLERIDAALASSPSSNRIKFDLLQYRYVALFNLQRIEQLHKETSQWLERPNLPVAFTITVYIYFAKSAMVLEDESISQKYADKAIALLKDMQQAFPSPIRLIELANLKMQYGQVDEALTLLTNLEQKFINSKNAYFQMELHGNLGHITRELELYDKSLGYWESASYWAEIYGNKQQQAVIFFNQGYVYQLKHLYVEAIEAYGQAHQLAKEAQDLAKLNQANFRIAQCYFKLGKLQQAKEYMQQVDIEDLPFVDHPEFNQLQQEL